MGHGSVWHDVVSVSDPVQFFPVPEGAGLSQRRFMSKVPVVPQGPMQGPVDCQEDHSPSAI